ncbi:serine hydrolase domain-containing protein [Paenibacillus sp. GCM10027629]|uniref:serine hydrolase domain-containing protein n=1 Tax=Paenibacillus sp. GCM10027629 TaxID=3273414 RepID=UPI00362C5081
MKRRVLQLILVSITAFQFLLSGCQTIGRTVEAAEVPTRPLSTKEVSKFVEQFLQQDKIKKMNVPGGAVVVVKGDKILYEKGFGYANLDKKIAVNPEKTVFLMASTTKSFTATAIMQLVEQGKIDLNTNIQTYLKDVKIDNPYKEPINVKHLLDHTAGFASNETQKVDFEEDLSKIHPMKPFLQSNMPPVVRKPGEVYVYNNFNYTLLGYMVEKVSGMPFEQYMKKHVFQPLEMKNSSLYLSPEIQKKRSLEYDPNGHVIPPYTWTPTIDGAAALNATPDDIAHFMIAQLNSGFFKNKHILQPKTVHAMQEYQSKIHPEYPDTTLGFENSILTQDHHNQLVISKGGDGEGFSNLLTLLPEQKVGFFIVGNKPSDIRQEFYKQFMDHFYPTKKQPTYLKTPQEELQRFAGTFIDLRKDFLITHITPHGDGELVLENNISFINGNNIYRQIDPLLFINDEGQMLAFKENPDGSIAYMKNLLSYAQKSKLPYFSDVQKDDAYAQQIRNVQVSKLLPSTWKDRFEPNKPITWGEFITMTMLVLEVSPTIEPEQRKNGSIAEEVQKAKDNGIINAPVKIDAPIQRQEAATFFMKAAKKLRMPEIDTLNAQITGEVNDSSKQGVKAMVALELFGPEVTTTKTGVDYHAKQNMLRKEAAALISEAIYKLAP